MRVGRTFGRAMAWAVLITALAWWALPPLYLRTAHLLYEGRGW